MSGWKINNVPGCNFIRELWRYVYTMFWLGILDHFYQNHFKWWLLKITQTSVKADSHWKKSAVHGGAALQTSAFPNSYLLRFYSNIPFKSEHFMYDLIQLMHDEALHVGFFQLLRQRNASCRRLLAVLSGYHIRKCCAAPQHYFHQCESSFSMYDQVIP